MDRRVALPLLILVSACIHVYQSIRPRPLDPHTPVVVTTPVKAHLVDGSTVVFLSGVTVDSTQVRGDGNRYSLTLRDSAAVTSIPLDSIVGMEAFEQSVNGASSFVVSVLATGGLTLGVAALAVAIFGSCPTVYADSSGTALLQAEGFSYSIAPIFESRDVDRLRLVQAADGSVRLEIRNEALETHYLNHLELLEVMRLERFVAVYAAPRPVGRLHEAKPIDVPALEYRRDAVGESLRLQQRGAAAVRVDGRAGAENGNRERRHPERQSARGED